MRFDASCRHLVLRLLVVLATACAAVAAVVTLPHRAGAAPGDGPGSITLHVQSARTVQDGDGFIQKGDPVDTYKWLINVDDTGDPGTADQPGYDKCLPATAVGGSTDPDYADSCQWPSTRTTSGFTPIVAQGDQTDLSDGTALHNLPPGKYLISVTADGYKIDGAHFTVTAGDTSAVTVAMQPLPLPLTTYRLQVFNDNTPVDATYEVDAEAGLRGFTASLTDVLGQVSTDYYGNPLCTRYLRIQNGQQVSAPIDSDLPIAFVDDAPVVDPASTGRCVSDRTGQIVIPNLGPNRYAATVSPPAPQPGQTYQWVQTTTLEGAHDHDMWQQEGETGFDTEQTRGAELVPSVQFGFVKTMALSVPVDNPPTGEIKGVAIAGLPYVGGQNGQPVPETGMAGAKSGGPIRRPWIALSDLDANDAQIYVGRGARNGSFDIKNVPNGTYQLSIWDDDQDYILWSFNVEVHRGRLTDVGNKMIVGWFTHLYGHVFIDTNGNGKQDNGERGVPQFALTVRERDNSLMDQYTNTATTDDSGFYNIRETYPMSKWLVLEAFNTRYQTTGITYKGENESRATTKLGSLVDVDFLPIIGLGGRIDWGVQPYARGANGGIVGTVTYDTTRNELDPADAATEPYQPGIPDVKVALHLPVRCAPDTPADHCRQGYQLDDSGAMIKGPEVQDAYTSETWAAPRGCTARQYDGTPLTDQQALPEFGAAANRLCVEAPMMGVQTGPSDATPGNAGQTVNGNYGFGSSKINQWPATDTVHNPHGLDQYAPLHCLADPGQSDPPRDATCPAGSDYDYADQDLRNTDYLVSVDIPNDPVDDKPMYKVTSEEDVNVFDGDTYLPQQNFPPTTVAMATNTPPGDQPTPTPPAQPPSQQAGIISPCAGALHTVHVTDPAFVDGGGSPFEGLDRPSCADKLVTVRAGQSTAPNFNLFTDVPIPTHFWGLTINDLGLSLDKRSVNFGEAQGLPFVPVGLYDWSGRLMDTVHTDVNGMYEALEPSTDTFNCPVPAGPCPNMYRFVGNDPGRPGALNPDYNPRFRTIATNFQGWPGLYTVTDTAPTQVAATALAPDTTVANSTMCDLGAHQPQLLAVDKPYVRADGDRTVTVTGFGFGADTGTVSLDDTTAAVQSWSDTSITFTVPAAVPFGARRLTITQSGADALSSVNGLTLQVLAAASSSTPGSTPANPRLYEVGPGPDRTYHTVQGALEAAVPTRQLPYDMVVVWPDAQTDANPHGEYNENVIVHHRVKIQGVGPGGFLPDKTYVPGSIIDGAGFNPDNPNGTAWINLLGTLAYSGDPAVPDAAVVTVLDDPNGVQVSTTQWPMTIDGLTITGGAQSDFAGNVNEITGVVHSPYGATGALVTQGGGIYVHNNVRSLRVTDNVIRGNGGSYGGAIRVGTPYVGDNRNYSMVIADNQIRDNGGTNLAGGIGLFTGSDGYLVTRNAICGNFSAEYGGAVSAFGYNANQSPGGGITRNRIWFNQSYDEGGAVMIAGELPARTTQLSEGSGPVTIDRNVIQANLANDDGGGIRLLQVAGSHVTRTNKQPITITNNTIANNVSAHEGGGIALDDAPFVDVIDNTIAKNMTTATAVTSDGLPAPAGLSTAANSDLLQARLCGFANATPLCSTKFSKPTVLDDVFWDNRAGTFNGGQVTGIGGTLPGGGANSIDHWDMGVADLLGVQLNPVGSIVQATRGTNLPTPGGDPNFVSPYDVTVNVLASRTYPAFRQAVIVAEIVPPSLMGDYHLGAGSSAIGAGLASLQVIWGTPLNNPLNYIARAVTPDIDGQPRPTGTRYDAGSDQLPS